MKRISIYSTGGKIKGCKALINQMTSLFSGQHQYANLFSIRFSLSLVGAHVETSNVMKNILHVTILSF
jgi:hypothetical protein